MKSIFIPLVLFASTAKAQFHQDFSVQLFPASKSLAIRDEIHAPDTKQNRFHFRLNKTLSVVCLSVDDQIQLINSPSDERFNEYEVIFGADKLVTLEYQGVIDDPVVDDQSSGLISSNGASLFGESYWIPVFNEFSSYKITNLSLPADWILASPMSNKIPQPDLYLVAGPFKKYSLEIPGKTPFFVYLRKDDTVLAQNLLSPLPAYLDHFSELIGPYAYDSFTVIENFWETGFGMPAFTLLGPGVIRLPFILNTSLPHELLHNWWGNGVFVDYQRGNWSEGLTSFGADYSLLPSESLQKDYRLNILMSYQDYTRSAPDFPLRKFTGRHNSSSQAIGYGKGLMLFHMLKNKLSTARFDEGLRLFYRDNRGKSVSFEEVQAAFQKISGENLDPYFSQWLDRTGAPSLEIKNISVNASRSEVSFQLEQMDPRTHALLDLPYELEIPLYLTNLRGEVTPSVLAMKVARSEIKLALPTDIKKVEIDPHFEVFRWLAPEERPSSISRVLGAKNICLVSPESALQDAYENAWKNAADGEITKTDEQILQHLPASGAVVLIGNTPVYETFMKESLKDQSFDLTPSKISIQGQEFDRNKTTTVITASIPGRDLTVLWISGPKSLESFAPRLLHYGKFGVLAFEDKSNVLKTSWPVLHSPLTIEIP